MTAVRIERIAAGGAGVARQADGMVVFVPRTAPGDLVEVEIRERRRRHARARILRVIEPGPGRVEAGCRHYTDDHCGGCQLQHLSPDVQRAAKARIVGDALRRIGRRAVADPEVVAAPRPWRYRTRISLAMRGDAIGLHRLERPGDIFDLEDCPITVEPVMELWTRIRARRDLLPPGRQGLVLRRDRAGGLHVVLEGAAPAWDAGPLARAVGEPGVSYWWRPAGGAGRVVAGPRRGFPALAFEQVNPPLADRIRRDAVAALGCLAGRVVWDLYAGVGDAARLLAAAGARVWMVERDRRAVDWARCQVSGPGTVEAILGRVEESLHRLPHPDAVVLNPPREGLARPVAERLERWAAGRPEGRVAYVSCDPATLARDLARLPSLGLRHVAAYDLFPQTSHVEVLVVLGAS